MDPMATVEHTARVAELRAGTEVEGVFACTRKDRLTAKSGTPYLAIEPRDRTGAIQARAFREADFLAGQFERGDLVAVRGRVERFRDELQVELGAAIEVSQAGSLVGHVALGQQLLVERAARIDGFPAEKLNAVSHCL